MTTEDFSTIHPQDDSTGRFVTRGYDLPEKWLDPVTGKHQFTVEGEKLAIQQIDEHTWTVNEVDGELSVDFFMNEGATSDELEASAAGAHDVVAMLFWEGRLAADPTSEILRDNVNHYKLRASHTSQWADIQSGDSDIIPTPFFSMHTLTVSRDEDGLAATATIEFDFTEAIPDGVTEENDDYLDRHSAVIEGFLNDEFGAYLDGGDHSWEESNIQFTITEKELGSRFPLTFDGMVSEMESSTAVVSLHNALNGGGKDLYGFTGNLSALLRAADNR